MITLEVLVGMIASGKSTYARQRADQGAIIVCHDDLTAMLHTRYRYEQELRNCYRRMEEGIVIPALDFDRNVLIDRTHLTRESRERWINLILTRRYSGVDDPRIIAITFPIEAPEVHARRRFESDPRGRSFDEWLTVARHHREQAQAEPVSLDERFDAIIDSRSLIHPVETECRSVKGL